MGELIGVRIRNQLIQHTATKKIVNLEIQIEIKSLSYIRDRKKYSKLLTKTINNALKKYDEKI